VTGQPSLLGDGVDEQAFAKTPGAGAGKKAVDIFKYNFLVIYFY